MKFLLYIIRIVVNRQLQYFESLWKPSSSFTLKVASCLSFSLDWKTNPDGQNKAEWFSREKPSSIPFGFRSKLCFRYSGRLMSFLTSKLSGEVTYVVKLIETKGELGLYTFIWLRTLGMYDSINTLRSFLKGLDLE